MDELIRSLDLRPHPEGGWFGASVDMPGSYALVGCSVAPGFGDK